MALWLECWRSVPADSGQLCYLVLVGIAVVSPMSHCANNQFANVLDQFTNVLYVSLLMDYVHSPTPCFSSSAIHRSQDLRTHL